MGGSSPEAYFQNFMAVLKKTSPKVRLLILLGMPCVKLITVMCRYNFVPSVPKLISSWFTASVSIPSHHPLQNPSMAYMLDQGLGKNARTLALTVGEPEPFARHYDSDQMRDQLKYVPAVGTYAFSYKGYSMTYEKLPPPVETTRDRGGEVRVLPPKENTGPIVISCRSLFAGAKPIQDLLDELKASVTESTEFVTMFYRATPRHGDGKIRWDYGINRPARTLAAVTLDAEIKDGLVNDIENYLDPKTRRFYIENIIPYRRGYLLYGPPGTGKTTMATAIAGEYRMEVYLLSLAQDGLTDPILDNLFDWLPRKCILLLEDIDSAGIGREDMIKAKEKQQKKKDDKQDGQEDEQRGITLSGLLNNLDGVQAAEGRIILMTTNSPDSLDKALVRPGRIDRKVLFGHASHEVCTKLYTRIFTKSAAHLADGETAWEHDIPALAKAFADQIPTGVITPAEVQGHLLQNRTDPVAAVSSAALFAKETVEAKKKGKNVASFANEVTGAVALGGETGADESSSTDASVSGTSTSAPSDSNASATADITTGTFASGTGVEASSTWGTFLRRCLSS